MPAALKAGSFIFGLFASHIYRRANSPQRRNRGNDLSEVKTRAKQEQVEPNALKLTIVVNIAQKFCYDCYKKMVFICAFVGVCVRACVCEMSEEYVSAYLK